MTIDWRDSKSGDEMKLDIGEFGTIDWRHVPATEHPGETGMATWRTVERGDVRVRMVEYSAGYLADHWCIKGHVILVVTGELVNELQDGRKNVLSAGMCYTVSDGGEPHRSQTSNGAKLFIVD
jgi:hypothetical protein